MLSLINRKIYPNQYIKKIKKVKLQILTLVAKIKKIIIIKIGLIGPIIKKYKCGW